MSSVKAENREGITAIGFVNRIIRKFGSGSSSVSWKDLGIAVSNVFHRGPQCCTMIGPMEVEVKQRKAYVRGKRVKPTSNDTPEELGDVLVEEETETVKNVAVMFNILRKNRIVKLENLILDANSFAQTVENIFTLSFLVKDGRVEIKVNDEGHHLVSPRNAPSADAVASGDVAYCHFVFRFDFNDWKVMKESIGNGEQLMRNRCDKNISGKSRSGGQCDESRAAAASATTPIDLAGATSYRGLAR